MNGLHRPERKARPWGALRGWLLERLGNRARQSSPSRLKNRAGRVLAMLLGDPAAVTAQIDGVTLFLRPAGRTTAEPFWSGCFDDEVVDILAAFARPGCTIVDIGANVGLIGLRLAGRLRERGGGRVLLFEPVPANAQLLRRAVDANGLGEMVEVEQVALYDRAGTMQMVVEGVGELTGNAMLDPQQVGRTRRMRTSSIEVPLARLDDLVNEGKIELDGLDLMKVDAEGADVRCLAGAASTIARYLPIIYGEFHVELLAQHGDDLAAAARLLVPLGYAAFGFSGSRRLIEVELQPGRGNLFLVPAARRDAFRQAVIASGGEVALA